MSFEFKNRKATPIIRGIVIASEHEALILEVREIDLSYYDSLTPIGVSLAEQAYWQAEQHRAEKEEIKRRADVLKRWARLVKGLQIRRRLQTQYQRADAAVDIHGDDRDANVKGKTSGTQQIIVQVSTADPEPDSVLQGSHDVATSEVGESGPEVRYPRVTSSLVVRSCQIDPVISGLSQVHHDPDLFHAGGFIATADEIVQPFSLPRSQYLRPKDRAPSLPASDDDVEMVPDSEDTNRRDSMKNIEGGREYDNKGDKLPSEPQTTNEPMKTMAELAAEHAERQHQLELGSTRISKLSSRGVGSSRARRKAADDESEDEHISESSVSNYLSDSPAPGKRKVAPSRIFSRKNPKSSAKSTPKTRNKRPRSPDVDESPDEYGGSSRSKSASAGSHPRRKTTRAANATSRATRTVSGSSTTSIAVPASDRVLRSRKARV